MTQPASLCCNETFAIRLFFGRAKKWRKEKLEPDDLS